MKQRQNYYGSMPALTDRLPPDRTTSMTDKDTYPHLRTSRPLAANSQSYISNFDSPARQRPPTPVRQIHHGTIKETFALFSPTRETGETAWRSARINDTSDVGRVAAQRLDSRRPPTLQASEQHCDYDDTESFVSVQTDGFDTPLTFTQANDALNSFASNSLRSSRQRSESGAKSADSAFHGRYGYEPEDGVLTEDDIRYRFEREYEESIQKQSAWLEFMEMEKLSLEGRIQRVTRQRQELVKQLLLFRQNSEGTPKRCSFRMPCGSRGLYPSHSTYMQPSWMTNPVHPAEQIQIQSPYGQYVGWNMSDPSLICSPPCVGTNYGDYKPQSPDWNTPTQFHSPPLIPPHRHQWQTKDASAAFRRSFPDRYNDNLFQQDLVSIELDRNLDGRVERNLDTSVLRLNDSSQPGLKEMHVRPNNMFYESKTKCSPQLSTTPTPDTCGDLCSQPKSPNIRNRTNASGAHFHSSDKPKLVNELAGYPRNLSPTKPFLLLPSLYPSTTLIPHPPAISPAYLARSNRTNADDCSSAEFWPRQLQPPRHYPDANVSHPLAVAPGVSTYPYVRRRPRNNGSPQSRIELNVNNLQHPQFYSNQDLYAPPSLKEEEQSESAQSFKAKTGVQNVSNKFRVDSDSLPPLHSLESRITPPSAFEPINPELAEICARDLSQPTTSSKNRTSAINRASYSTEQLPAHAEEDAELEPGTTPVKNPMTTIPETPSAPVDQKEAINTLSMKEEHSIQSQSHTVNGSNRKDPLVVPTQNPLPLASQPSDFRAQVRIIRAHTAVPCEGKGDLDKNAKETQITSSLSTRSKSIFDETSTSPTSIQSTTSEASQWNGNKPVVPIEMDNAPLGKYSFEVDRETIDMKAEVKLMCLGPIDGFQLDRRSYVRQTFLCNESTKPDSLSPIWIAICTGETAVSIYDLKTRVKLLNCYEHEQYSNSPVTAILPFVATSNIVKNSDHQQLHDELTRKPLGILCVIQKDGNMTLYNVASRRTSGRFSVNKQVQHVMLLPQTKIMQNCLAQNLLVIDRLGDISCCQWIFTVYITDQTNLRHPQWDGEVHDLGANILKQLFDDGPSLNYVCCVCPYQNTNHSERQSRQDTSPVRNSVITSKGLQPVNYCLIAICLLKPAKDNNLMRLRIVCLVPSIENQLKTVSNVYKQITTDPESDLVGVSYAEIAGATSICVCLTNEVYWFSLKTLDMVSTLKLPMCAQPANLLSPIWPHTFADQTTLNERLWVAASGGRLLEITAFDSQRRRNSDGQSYLIMLCVIPSDSKITAVTSTLNDKVTVLVGTNKGKLHVIRLPNSYHACKIPGCSLGFITPDDLLHHLIREHYLTDGTCYGHQEHQCGWPECEFLVPVSKHLVDLDILESHARQHIMAE
ncbi:hypothetical protein EG68_04581 [Paragonimus skrjabini miyazakii]|uniref:C2H2-type domain-containing protein n=1 Tax=Paragonimus skrjabini miyazakii TaxID=59628 RepID=A0A8S9YRU9_9TREM|nr:hypothetical protein EG68_04581 [Paragonimus skrjabini miyazakii]